MNAPLYPRTNYPEADERASAGARMWRATEKRHD